MINVIFVSCVKLMNMINFISGFCLISSVELILAGFLIQSQSLDKVLINCSNFIPSWFESSFDDDST